MPRAPASDHLSPFPRIKSGRFRVASNWHLNSISAQLSSPFLVLPPGHRDLGPERLLHFRISRPPVRALNFGHALADKFFRSIDVIEFACVAAEKLGLIRLWQL